MNLGEAQKQDEQNLIKHKENPLFVGGISVSRVQRVLRIGYNRAAHVIERAIESGVLERIENNPHLARFAKVAPNVAEREVLAELLERSIIGLEWYRDKHPESWNGADDDHLIESKKALGIEIE